MTGAQTARLTASPENLCKSLKLHLHGHISAQPFLPDFSAINTRVPRPQSFPTPDCTHLGLGLSKDPVRGSRSFQALQNERSRSLLGLGDRSKRSFWKSGQSWSGRAMSPFWHYWGGAEGRVSILALLRGRERPQVQKKDENINRSSEWWDLDYFILFSSCSLYTLIFCMILSSQMFKHKLFLLCKQNKFCALFATPQGKLKQAVNWASLHLMPPQHLHLRHN